MTTPRLGLPELTSGQAVPETTVNEQVRGLEGFAGHAVFIDRDLATPPGSPADGDMYLVAASPTGEWAGHEDEIAYRLNTAWTFYTPFEGLTAWVNDENVLIGYDGSAWNVLSSPSGTYAALSQTKEMIAGFIASPSNKSYTIALKMAHGGTITETTTISVSGTCTATFKVNSTALGGTANSVSSSEQSQAHASTNTFVAGDDIVLTVSSNSSCADMSFSIKYTRTLD